MERLNLFQVSSQRKWKNKEGNPFSVKGREGSVYALGRIHFSNSKKIRDKHKVPAQAILGHFL